MKNLKKSIIIQILVVLLLFTSILLNSDNYNHKKTFINNVFKIDSVEVVDSVLLVYNKSKKKKQKEINKIKKQIKKYNPKIDDDFIFLFLKTIDTFRLSKYRDFLVAQIITESGANHYSKYTKNILIGSSGECGMCQILPSTAFYTIINMNKSDLMKMGSLGATKTTSIKTINDAKIWISKKENNIILFAYITKNHMNMYRNDIEKSLISYNAGIGGMKIFIDSGGILTEHRYYKNVISIKNKI